MKRLTLCLLPLLLILSSSAVADDYTILIVGNDSGSMSIEEQADGRVAIDYQFSDRGRGPDIRARYTLNDTGLPVEVAIEGVDYMKAPVSESLAIDDGEFAWQSAADQGRSPAAGFYVSLDGPPGEILLLVRALQAAESQHVNLLPTGEARLEQVGSVTLEDGTELKQLEIHGLGFEPAPLWLTADNKLFAMVSGWFSVVTKGNESEVAQLKALQDQRRDDRFRVIAETAAHTPEGAVVIDNARIIDVETGTVMDENAVVIEQGRIKALLSATDPRPAAAEVINARGRSLVPGLWDMHTHLSLSDGPLQLAAGVTTVRDLANDPEQLGSIMQAFENGTSVGPHVFKAGIIDGTGPFAGPTQARVETPEEAAHWVDFYADNGYQQIKIYSSVKPELVPAMAERAHQRGMRVSGHISAGSWAEDAIRAGYDEIQHINMVFLNFYKDIVETRNPDRFIKVAERGADLDPESGSFQAFVDLLLEKGTVVDPTVAVFMDLFTHTPGQLAPSLGTAAGRLPPQVLRGNLKGGLEVPAGWEERYSASGQQMLVIIKALHEAGVPLVAGTDGLAGFTLQAELAYYQQAGIAAADILRLVTLGSAEVMGVADQVGRIAPGQRADLLLVPGQPEQDITALQRVNWVMKAGQVLDPALLYESMSIRPSP